MTRFVLAAALLASLAACDKGKGQAQGLPPAKSFNENMGDMPPVQQEGTASPHTGGGANPHAGVDMGGGDSDNPHAGVDMSGAGGDNPHAGVDMSGAGGDNPHAGVDMSGGTNPHAGGGVDVAKMGLPAPDPNRPIDPTHVIKGMIKVHPKAASRVKAGTAVFVVVKQAGADGSPTGSPLAVDKLTWGTGDLPFEITEKQAMIAGTQLTGDVIITAHYDQDGDAISKEPGDIIGTARVKIPADKVTVTLDDVIN
jgi:hypothetical protein